MSFWEVAAVLAAAVAAGAVNAVVGSGTLITFPTLLGLGYPPVLANVSNAAGLAPGSAAAVIGYRRELVGQRARLCRLGAASTVGALIGGALLLSLPDDIFGAVVPVLIGIACVLVLLQPRLTAALGRRRTGPRPRHGGPVLAGAVLATGIYGGYFGAAQGILLIALLGMFLDDDLQRLNAAKNVLATIANLVAAGLFVAVSDIDWRLAGLLAVGSIAGGLLGARYGRRLPPGALRVFVVAVGLSAIGYLLIT